MLLHPVRELRAHDVLEARVVLDLGGVPELAPVDTTLEHEGGDAGAAGIEGRRLPRGAAADDDDLVALGASVLVGHLVLVRHC